MYSSILDTGWDSNFLLWTSDALCYELQGAWVISSIINICIFQVNITVFKEFSWLFHTYDHFQGFSRSWKFLNLIPGLSILFQDLYEPWYYITCSLVFCFMISFSETLRVVLISGGIATSQEAYKHRHDHPCRAWATIQPQLKANVGRDRNGRRRTPDGKGSGPRVVLQPSTERKADKSAVSNDAYCTVLCYDSAPAAANHFNSQWKDCGTCHSARGCTACGVRWDWCAGSRRGSGDTCPRVTRAHPRDDCCNIELAALWPENCFLQCTVWVSVFACRS